ncbi:DDE family transposase [Methanohalophilus euhalobius]|uniref:DDE family transposase n=1 Tax=Methanohalophilus euhalobius TaxID=51203 RepID=A0A285G4F2_9EURY|nr:MAG: transposase [Methanohalophilus sp.]TCL12041.1 DDE family transposase [Methanohalophilus euhalobius]SNY18429.1 Transposase DDE domain-containing protein [Methanohalophilus euhalobius]
MAWSFLIQNLNHKDRLIVEDWKLVKKRWQIIFWVQTATIIDKENELIRRFETTVASVHDSQVDLSKKGEVVYRDKGYFEVAAKGFAATMQRAVRGKPLNIRQIMRNDRISVQRMPCERVYAVTKGVFKAGKVMVTAFCFNLHQMRTLKRKKVVD